MSTSLSLSKSLLNKNGRKHPRYVTGFLILNCSANSLPLLGALQMRQNENDEFIEILRSLTHQPPPLLLQIDGDANLPVNHLGALS